MSADEKKELEWYMKLDKKLDKILAGEMSLEDYSKHIKFKIDGILDVEESRLNARGKRLYHRPQRQI